MLFEMNYTLWLDAKEPNERRVYLQWSKTNTVYIYDNSTFTRKPMDRFSHENL